MCHIGTHTHTQQSRQPLMRRWRALSFGTRARHMPAGSGRAVHVVGSAMQMVSCARSSPVCQRRRMSAAACRGRLQRRPGRGLAVSGASAAGQASICNCVSRQQRRRRHEPSPIRSERVLRRASLSSPYLRIVLLLLGTACHRAPKPEASFGNGCRGPKTTTENASSTPLHYPLVRGGPAGGGSTGGDI